MALRWRDMTSVCLRTDWPVWLDCENGMEGCHEIDMVERRTGGRSCRILCTFYLKYSRKLSLYTSVLPLSNLFIYFFIPLSSVISLLIIVMYHCAKL